MPKSPTTPIRSTLASGSPRYSPEAELEKALKQPKPATRKLLPRAVELWQLPHLVPRPLAMDFSLLDERTFVRAEERGALHPIKRNKQTVSYLRSELLAFLGLAEDGSIARSKPAISKRRLKSGAVAR